MIPLLLVAAVAQGSQPTVEPGELHLRHVQQLTFGGQNAEAYFSASGKLLIFQRQGPAEQCDQMYVIGVDGGTTREQPVKKGRRSGDQVEILAGVKAGDPVVVEPGNLVSGEKVRVVR